MNEKTMAELLAEHKYFTAEAVCSCSDFVQVGLKCDKQTHPEHVAEVLTAAGFGLVKAAAAGALMEAADRLEKSAQNCVLMWGSEPMSALASASVSAINHDARRLRARAAELRQP